MKEDKTTLSESEIRDELSQLNGWKQDGIFLEKTYVFETFKQINQFLPYLTRSIVEQNHHPDFEFDGGARSVHLKMTTHTEGGITRADINLAKTLDAWDH